MKSKKKTISVFLIIIAVVVFSFSGCGKHEIKEIIEENGMTPENIAEWTMDIVYISETRGTGDKIYTTLGGDSDAFISILNSIYAADIAEKPKTIFSAEAMCQYKIEFYHTDKENPQMTFYFVQGAEQTLLTYVTKTKEGEETYINYEFFTPYGDVATVLAEQRADAFVPEDELAISFVSRTEMMSTIQEADLIYFVPEKELENNERDNTDIPFEFYEGELPDDKATNSQLYSSRTVAGILSDEYLLTSHVTNDKGISEEWSITEVRYNDTYTLVLVTRPQYDILDSLGLSPSSAILLKKADLPLDKWIVFLDIDNENKVVDVIDPELELH
ncbi:MAG: hypothetical protein AB1Z23_01265 [Eubacteriales bacterium]